MMLTLPEPDPREEQVVGAMEISHPGDVIPSAAHRFPLLYDISILEGRSNIFPRDLAQHIYTQLIMSQAVGPAESVLLYLLQLSSTCLMGCFCTFFYENPDQSRTNAGEELDGSIL